MTTLSDLAVVLTGGTSGIGRRTADRLVRRGARLLIVGLDDVELGRTCDELERLGTRPLAIRADLADLVAVPHVARDACAALGRVDVLINNAGVSSFEAFEEATPARTAGVLAVNVGAPMLLTQTLLPAMRARGAGRIVNIGSIFGSIGFPWFTTYSTTKFALRGFSEALRRELRGTGVEVTYVAPRATRTALTASYAEMAEAVKMTLDEPDDVARRIVDAIERDARDRYLGFPEKLFVRINAVLPRLVDRALAGQARVMRDFARRAPEDHR